MLPGPETRKTDSVQVPCANPLLCCSCGIGIRRGCFSSRLDLVPINRSVGLKAKPTKPVTEVLRPVVAKYGLHLSDLVARIVSPAPPSILAARRGNKNKLITRVRLFPQRGELEPLDLGLPISNLDGLRVVLDTAEHAPSTGKGRALTRYANTLRQQGCHVTSCDLSLPLRRQAEGGPLDEQNPGDHSKTAAALFPVVLLAVRRL